MYGSGRKGDDGKVNAEKRDFDNSIEFFYNRTATD